MFKAWTAKGLRLGLQKLLRAINLYRHLNFLVIWPGCNLKTSTKVHHCPFPMSQLLNPVQAGSSAHRPPARRFMVLGKPLQAAVLRLWELGGFASEWRATSSPSDLFTSTEQEGCKEEQRRLFSVVCDAHHAVETSEDTRTMLHDINCVEPYRAFLTQELVVLAHILNWCGWGGVVSVVQTLTSA